MGENVTIVQAGVCEKSVISQFSSHFFTVIYNSKRWSKYVPGTAFCKYLQKKLLILLLFVTKVQVAFVK